MPALSPRGEASSRRRIAVFDLVVVGVAALATLVLVLPTYARRPFWFDELVSVEIASSSWSALQAYVTTVEANMALYHAVLRVWLFLVDGEGGTRALSVIFAVATLPVLYALTRRLYDRRTAVFAVLLLSVNVSFVGYSRDARSYALTLLLVTASSYALVRAEERSGRVPWALYGVTAGLAVWAHLLAAFVVVAQVAWLWVERRGRRLPGLGQGLGVLVVLLAPLALIVVLGDQEPQLDWLPRAGVRKLPGLFLWFVESRVTLVLYFLGAATALVLTIAKWRRDRVPPKAETLLMLWLLVPPALAYVLSYATPLYLYRYFLSSLPALVILVAAGLARVRPAWAGIALVGGTLAFSARTTHACMPDCKIRHDDWRSAAAYIQSRIRPGDAIIAYPDVVRTPLDHYLPRNRPRLLYPERWTLVGGTREGRSELAAAISRAPGVRRLWLVTWWLPADEARELLADRMTRREVREFAGNVQVALYERRP